MKNRPKPVILAILDGWGVAPEHAGNAITRAKLPAFERFIRDYPVMTLSASGNEVGLSFGEMGNSEVGHLNIGAGRIYYQSYPRITKSIDDKTFFKNKAFLQAVDHVKEHEAALHLIGLVSPGNVHASETHCYALLELAKKHRIKQVFVHVILDGRDTKFDSGRECVKRLQKKMHDIGVGHIASISGRYYALDRDHRWDRVEKAYRAMVDGEAETYGTDPIDLIDASYKKKIYDEEFVPTVLGSKEEPVGIVKDADAIIFFNFRADRARELTESFVLPSFSTFERTRRKKLFFVTMTEYEKEIPVTVAFPPVVVHHSLAEVCSEKKLTQFHIAETEKYAHITFFLNGTIEEPFPGEERKIIPSPKVSSYDQAPDMAAGQITKEVLRAIERDVYDVIFVNYANADMVGHTGDVKATIKGVEAIDKGLGAIADRVLAKNGLLLITADHGNAEEIVNVQTGEKDKEHSTNPVPFLIISNDFHGQAGPAGDPPDGDLSLIPPVGMLADVAPTMLTLMGIEVPKEMTGRTLMKS